MSGEDSTIPTKVCTKCKQLWPATTEYFHCERSRKNGLTAKCKLCRQACYRAWRIANLEKERGRARLYHAQHAETLCARMRARYAADPRKNRFKNRRYRAKHPGKNALYNNRRRAKKRAVAINDFTHAQWIEIQAQYDHRCVYCGRRRKGKLTQDHITPLSKGGNHTANNIVPACQPCNSRKCTNKPLIQVQPVLLLCS